MRKNVSAIQNTWKERIFKILDFKLFILPQKLKGAIDGRIKKFSFRSKKSELILSVLTLDRFSDLQAKHL